MWDQGNKNYILYKLACVNLKRIQVLKKKFPVELKGCFLNSLFNHEQ